MAAVATLLATGAALVGTSGVAARELQATRTSEVPSHLLVPETGKRCGATLYDVCCPTAYGACAPGMVCMGDVCMPCGDGGEAECDEGAGRLWSATFHGSDEYPTPSPVALPVDLNVGVEAQGGFYGYNVAGEYGDVLGVYGGDDVLGEYGAAPELLRGGAPGLLIPSPAAGAPTLLPGGGTPTLLPGGGAGTPAPATSGVAAGVPAAPGVVGGAAGGSGATAGSTAGDTDAILRSTTPTDAPDSTTADDSQAATTSSIPAAGAAVAAVAALLVGVAALAYTKRASLFGARSPARPVNSA